MNECGRAAMCAVITAALLSSGEGVAAVGSRCVWYGVCLKKHYCSDDNPARAVSSSDIFGKICEFQYSSLCCNIDQQRKLKSYLGYLSLRFNKEAAGILKKTMCAMTCSPRQSAFMNVTQVDANGVSAVAMRIPKSEADKVYAGVLKGDSTSKVFGSPKNTEDLFRKIGAAKKDGGYLPFTVNFVLYENMEMDKPLQKQDAAPSPIPDVARDAVPSPAPDVEIGAAPSPVNDDETDAAPSPVPDVETDVESDAAPSPVPDVETDVAPPLVPDVETDAAPSPVPDVETDVAPSPVPDVETVGSRCVWYGVCSANHFCLDHEAARSISDNTIFANICGFDYPSLCCDIKQQEKLKKTLQEVSSVFKKDAANILKKAMCALTCSPKQANFMNATQVDATGVSGVTFRIPKREADKVYDGLRFLKYITMGFPSDAKALFHTLGKSKDYSPLTIDYILDANMTIEELLQEQVETELSFATEKKKDAATPALPDASDSPYEEIEKVKVNGGHCVWYGICSKDHFCSDDGAARPVSDNDIFAEICGFNYTSLCCDVKQQENLKSNLSLVSYGFNGEAAVLLKKAMCAMTCSNRQSAFINVIQVNGTGVSAITFRIPKKEADVIYNGLGLLASGIFGLPRNTESFFRSFGKSKENGGRSPFTINFKFDENMTVAELLQDQNDVTAPVSEIKAGTFEPVYAPTIKIKPHVTAKKPGGMKTDPALVLLPNVETSTKPMHAGKVKTDKPTPDVTQIKIVYKKATKTTVTSDSRNSKISTGILLMVLAVFNLH